MSSDVYIMYYTLAQWCWMEKSLNGIPISKVLCSYLYVAGPISQLVFKSVDKNVLERMSCAFVILT